MKVMQLPSARGDSYEGLLHQVRGDNFLLPLRNPKRDGVRERLSTPRLQRSIGVVYDPETYSSRNYDYVSLPDQFDEYIWFDQTRAVAPLSK